LLKSNPYIPILFYSLFVLFLSPIEGLSQSNQLKQRAENTPENLNKNIPALVKYLMEEIQSEQDKAYVLFVWLTNYLEYDHQAINIDRRINRSIYDILNRKKGICFDYATLYQRLCEEADIVCYRVDGYAFGQLGPRSLPSTPNHSWNAIFINNEWHLLDPTWGFVTDELAVKHQTNYFLTPPELFILNHLPANPIWQLLDCIISKEAFEKGTASIQRAIDSSKECISFSDSLSVFSKQSFIEQRLWEAEATWRFHPSADNRRFYAQVVFDYGVAISERADSLLMSGQLNEFVQLQKEAIDYCFMTDSLTTLQDWQTEFLAGLFINTAVGLSQMEEATTATISEAIKYLQDAKVLLLQLPEESYYRQYAGEQVEQFLEILRYR
jgi:hypothetical protein